MHPTDPSPKFPPDTIITYKKEGHTSREIEGVVLFQNDNGTYALRFGRGIPAVWNAKPSEVKIKVRHPGLNSFAELFKRPTKRRNLVPDSL